ncbi:hypothetical protein QTP86_013421 [Hemibagrus guttatus]|nr:hypothetical protein QTP86_013421 [Hemibagrus guttatus]
MPLTPSTCLALLLAPLTCLALLLAPPTCLYVLLTPFWVSPNPKPFQTNDDGSSERERKLRQTFHDLSSNSGEEYGVHRERIPTLQPGQFDGSTSWREFLSRFEDCARANHWSERTMTVQMRFCLVGAVGAVIHKNPRSGRWDYARIVEEVEAAYGPSSEHAAAIGIELRQRVRKAGELLHVLRDDIYEKVSIVYADRSEREQDSISVEVFTNAMGDADIVQRLLEERPRTLARAYEIAHSGARRSVLPRHCYETIKADVRPPFKLSTVHALQGISPINVEVLGEVDVPIQIGTHTVSVNFIVANVAEGTEAILGHPFLEQARARLDFGSKKIVLFGEQIPYFNPRNKPRAHIVRIARTAILEAGREYIVPGNAHFREQVQGNVLLSHTKGFIKKHRVMVARIVVDAHSSNQIPIRLYNPGNIAVKGESLLEFSSPLMWFGPQTPKYSLQIHFLLLFQVIWSPCMQRVRWNWKRQSCLVPTVMSSLQAPQILVALTWCSMTFKPGLVHL